MKPPEIRRAEPRRPPSQRWLKRPPRPSRAGATPLVMPKRRKPGVEPFLMALGTGIACGIIAAILTPFVTVQPGMAGLFTGLGFSGGFVMMWRGLGFRLQEVREVFK